MDVLRGRRTPLDSLPEQPAGRCGCGCNAEVPGRFVLGHQKIRRGPLAEERDCGYLTPCWVWLGARTSQGYGECGNRREGARRLAHRAVYEAMIGPIPGGLTIDHLCANPLCVNPGHHEPVTLAENTRRQWRAGRAHPNRRRAAQTHCVRGHEFTAANTLVSCGRRRCRTCARERARAQRSAV